MHVFHTNEAGREVLGSRDTRPAVHQLIPTAVAGPPVRDRWDQLDQPSRTKGRASCRRSRRTAPRVILSASWSGPRSNAYALAFTRMYTETCPIKTKQRETRRQAERRPVRVFRIQRI